MQLLLHEFELPLKYPFTIARGSKSSARSLIVELHEGGLSGYGEAPESDYYGWTIARCRAAIERVRTEVETDSLHDPAALWARLDARLATCRAAQSALDQAAWDLWGKRQGRPLYALWRLDTSNNPPSDYTLGIDEPQVMLTKLREFADWPVFKIKLGTRDDLARLTMLREHSNARFRVDANGGWSAETAAELAEALAGLGVELIEQPLPADQPQAAASLYTRSPLPLVADESCVVEADVERCVGAFHGVNIKLSKCGGLTPARRMLEHARKLGLRTMIGCMTESTVGVSAAAQLLPLVDYADLDGPLLLTADVARGVTFERGTIHYSEVAGAGAALFDRAKRFRG